MRFQFIFIMRIGKEIGLRHTDITSERKGRFSKNASSILQLQFKTECDTEYWYEFSNKLYNMQYIVQIFTATDWRSNMFGK